jgi:hypothetical protein
VPVRPGETVRFAWPTDRIGIWLELRVNEVSGVSLARVTPGGTTELTWSANCRVTARGGVAPGGHHLARFTDADLERAVARAPKLLVYVWSPHMPLSIDGLQAVSVAARRLGLSLLPLAHPDADPSYVRSAALEAGVPTGATRPVHSIELAFREALVHAPSLLLYVDGRPAGPAVPGYRDAAGYERILRAQLAMSGGGQ